jgi:glycosyltransferase involved in cell wall biosynthesis
MNLVQITPGAGGMFCGNCLRDNALVAELRRQGHQALMVPLYLPLRLDEADQSAGTPIFYSGINVFLDEKLPLFRRAPGWLHRLLQSPALLRLASGRAAKTRPADVGALTVSMLRGEKGNQARELDDLAAWLQTHARPDVICLSNALLIGMARQLRAATGARMACMLQGEDWFLDGLGGDFRTEAWRLLGERLREMDFLMAPSRYFAELMAARTGLPVDRIRVVHNGISLAGYAAERGEGLPGPQPPVLGYFARMSRDKGLDLLVDAFLRLKARGRVSGLKLRVGGGCGPTDEPVVQEQLTKLRQAGVEADAEFHRNVSREDKLRFLESLSVFSVPARYGEAFGLYVVEALAAGVPVVQPRTAAFPELVEVSGAGVLCEPDQPEALADAIEAVLLDPARCGQLRAAALRAARDQFSVQAMARATLAVFGQA